MEMFETVSMDVRGSIDALRRTEADELASDDVLLLTDPSVDELPAMEPFRLIIAAKKDPSGKMVGLFFGGRTCGGP
jgi:hypothetical protein